MILIYRSSWLHHQAAVAFSQQEEEEVKLRNFEKAKYEMFMETVIFCCQLKNSNTVKISQHVFRNCSSLKIVNPFKSIGSFQYILSRLTIGWTNIKYVTSVDPLKLLLGPKSLLVGFECKFMMLPKHKNKLWGRGDVDLLFSEVCKTLWTWSWKLFFQTKIFCMTVSLCRETNNLWAAIKCT